MSSTPPTTHSQVHTANKIGSAHNKQDLEEAQRKCEYNAPLFIYVFQNPSTTLTMVNESLHSLKESHD